jgi:hypothetical protein
MSIDNFERLKCLRVEVYMPMMPIESKLEAREEQEEEKMEAET